MSVYVDHFRAPYGRMRMSHLIADTPDELRTMADALGLTRYLQHEGQDKEHLDVSESKRAEAIKLGAIPVTSRDLMLVIDRKRKGQHGENNPRTDLIHKPGAPPDTPKVRRLPTPAYPPPIPTPLRRL